MWYLAHYCVVFLSLGVCSVICAQERRDVRHLFPRRLNDTQLERRHDEEFYQKVYKFIRTTYQFGNLSYEEVTDMIEDVSDWTAPRELQEGFPYYLAGYDDEDRPIWMAEVGKYNVQKWTDMGEEGEMQLEKLVIQAALRILKSFFAKDRPERENREGMFVFDCEGFPAAQATHRPTVQFALRLVNIYRDLVEKALGEIIIINGFFVTEVAINFIRPLVGSIMEKVTIYGSNKSKWSAALRRLFPATAIPSWYGGSKDFTPLEVYG